MIPVADKPVDVVLLREKNNVQCLISRTDNRAVRNDRAWKAGTATNMCFSTGYQRSNKELQYTVVRDEETCKLQFAGVLVIFTQPTVCHLLGTLKGPFKTYSV